MLAYVDSKIMSDAANPQPETPPLTNSSNSELFNLALSAQQKNNLDEALNAYNQILASKDLTKDQASVAHHNLSLVYLGKIDFVKAQIENYLSLTANPSNNAAQNLNKSNEHFKNSVVQTDRSWSNSASLKFIPIEVFFVLLFASLFFMSRSLIGHFKSRALAAQDNLEAPQFPWLLKLFAMPVFLLGALICVRFYDENIVRAIVIKENTEVSTSAGANQALITTVNPGLEVIILRQQSSENSSYAQIRSTGQFSGWVKSENLVFIKR